MINAGVGNTGNGRWVKFLQAEAKRYNPQLLVLQIHANDFGDNIRERLFERSPTGELIELPVHSPGAERRIQSLIEGIPGLADSYLIGLSRQVSWSNNSSYWDPDSENSPGNSDRTVLEEQLLFGLLEEVLTICQEQGWQPLAVLVDIPDGRLAKMKTFLSVHNVLTVVIPSKGDRPDLYNKVDGHWNASGHSFTADRILEAVEKFHIQY